MKNLLNYFMSHQKFTLILAIAWTGFILFACFLPGDDVPKVDLFEVDKLVHIGLFGACSFLWGLSFKNYGNLIRFWIWLLGACIGLGILVELIQSTSWVQGRTGDYHDVLADTLGALLGIWLVRYCIRMISGKA